MRLDGESNLENNLVFKNFIEGLSSVNINN